MKQRGIAKRRSNNLTRAILFCLTFTALFVALSFLKTFAPQTSERIVHGILGTLAALLTTYLFLKIDKRSFADIGLKWERTTITKFFAGVFIGIVVMGLLTMGVIFFSGFQIETNLHSNWPNFLFCTLPLIPLAFMEELGFRGYPLRVLKGGFGIRSSIVITSILFACYHIVNGWTLSNAFLGAGVWGLVFGLAAIASNGISLPTGLHYAANLVTSAFGINNASFNIWILKQKDGSTLENYHTGTLATLIPQLILLVFAIISIEWFIRKRSRDSL